MGDFEEMAFDTFWKQCDLVVLLTILLAFKTLRHLVLLVLIVMWQFGVLDVPDIGWLYPLNPWNTEKLMLIYLLGDKNLFCPLFFEIALLGFHNMEFPLCLLIIFNLWFAIRDMQIWSGRSFFLAQAMENMERLDLGSVSRCLSGYGLTNMRAK